MMPSPPLVSIYVPTRNRIGLLSMALESVFSQDYPNLEVIVVDDGSDDGTGFYLQRLAAKGRIVHISHDVPQGAPASRNEAILIARGDFITGLDDDDLFEPGRISAFVEHWIQIIQVENIAGLYGGKTVRSGAQSRYYPALRPVDLPLLLTINCIGSQVFAPKQVYLAAGLFDPCMPAWQDWDLWVRMAKCCGTFLPADPARYIANEHPGTNRISQQAPEIIHQAMRRFMSKHEDLTVSQRVHILTAYLNYPMAIPSRSDCRDLLRRPFTIALIKLMRNIFQRVARGWSVR